jgi:NAD(P)-dependent dehydrogenase (short-subunit alcohol dehydrogenase family)
MIWFQAGGGQWPSTREMQEHQMRLKGKVAIITGAGAGIGRASAVLFAREGARVVVAERDLASGEQVAREITDEGHAALFVPTDVSSQDSMRALIERTISHFGRIDVLYNNAGGSTQADGPVTTAPIEEFWNKMRTDLFGTWLGCHYAIPHMVAQGGGSVINASSMYALVGTPNRDAYTAAKGAITALTRSMAVEFAKHKVRVNAVAAGGTKTERVSARIAQGGVGQKTLDSHLLGLAEPIDVAQAVLYLASDESCRTTGHILTVDSGLTMS